MICCSYCRYDYENCESGPANEMMANLNTFVSTASNKGTTYTSGDKTYTIANIDNFSYTDPVDKSVSSNQVIILITKGLGQNYCNY